MALSPYFRGLDSIELAHHFQVFGAGQVRIQVRFFGNVAQALLVCDPVAPDGLALE